ncbi:MAG: DUF2530 domain-containing protein [Terrimesophilobacter sp.]
MRLWLKDSERRPDRAPAATDDRIPLISGLILWLVALAVLLIASGSAGPSGDGSWIWACLIGAGIGAAGLAFVHRQRHKIAPN